MNHNREIKILLVEDDYLIADMIERILSELGYNNIIEASNGKQAIEKTRIMKPDIIIMDIEMPEMNGIEATQIIQDKYPTPVIILTAYENSKFIEQASKAGVSAYLIKPLKKNLVERSIAIALARHNDLIKVRKLNKKLEEKNLEMLRLNKKLKVKNNELDIALAEIKTLRGFVPICSNCKKIRDDEGFWNNVEAYISEHTEAKFTHGICPECMETLYGNEVWYKKNKDNL